MDSALWSLQCCGVLARCPLWQLDLKLTHLDWSHEAILIHFQGDDPNRCDLEYHILHGEIQRVQKIPAAVDVGEFCLVEDSKSARWYRGQVRNRKENLSDVYLLDHGIIMSVDAAHVSSCSSELLKLPPKLFSGFLANVLLLRSCVQSVMEEYLFGWIGKSVAGYVQGLLPGNVLLLEIPDINADLVRHGFGRRLDADSFLFMVQMLTGVPLKHDVTPDLVMGRAREPEFSWNPAAWKTYWELLRLGGVKLKCGTQVRVRLTAAIKSELFYCQLLGKEHELQEMSKKLAGIFERSGSEREASAPENLGLLCAVKGKDGNWCRGFLPFLPVNSQLSVFFVDYGFLETAKVENVHWLPPTFCSQPIMALPCSLWDPRTEQLHLLRAALLGEVFDVEVKSFDEERHLHSVTLTEVKDKEPIEVLQEVPTTAAYCPSANWSPHAAWLAQEKVLSETLEKTLAAESLSLNSVFVGFVEHVQNPNNFWIRTQKRNAEFEAMMKQISDHFRQVKLDEDVLVKPEVGALCCAMYEQDMHFYRAVVTNILPHGVKVLFIDFGNVEKVPYSLVKKIPVAFANTPPFAIYSSLDNVWAWDDVWTENTCNFFKNVLFNKTLKVQIVNTGKFKVGVELSELDEDKKWNIVNQLLSARGGECFSTNPNVEKGTNGPTRSLRLEPGETDDGLKTMDRWQICQERVDDQNLQFTTSFKAPSIKPGCEFTVRCCLINSPSDFWCQKSSQLPVLEELMGNVQRFYSTHRISLRPGASICIAKSPQDGRWFRAVSLEKHGDANTMLSVDYGHIVQVDKSHVQDLIPEFCSVEAQAFHCSLFTPVQLPDNSTDWNQKQCKLLKEFVNSSAGNLKCQIISQVKVQNKGLYNVVDLFNAQNQRSALNALLHQGAPPRDSPKRHLATIPESFVYCSYDLSPGCEEQIYVTHVVSQREFYCHLDKNTQILNDLLESISTQSEKTQDGNPVTVRHLCLAKYLDGKWHRSVAYPTSVPTHLNVFYVDFGNSNITEKSAVVPIPIDCWELLHIPMQAMRFCLHSVPETELHVASKEWLNDAILNKPARALIRSRNEDGSFDVELFDDDVCLNDKVKELLRLQSPQPKVTPDIEKDQEGSVASEQSQPDCPTVSSSSSVSTIKPCPKNPVWQMAPRFVSATKPQKNLPAKQAKQSDRLKTSRRIRLPDKNPPAGLKAKCFVSHINSIKNFYLQLSDDEAAILKMVDDLSWHRVRASLKEAAAVSAGDLVLAVNPSDDELYRAFVKRSEGGSTFLVEFVDYGDTAQVKQENIFLLRKDLQSQPRFSFPCSLLDQDSYDDVASFSDAVMDKPLMVEFVGPFAGGWEVQLEILDESLDANEAQESALPPEEDALWCSEETEETVTVAEDDSRTEEEPTLTVCTVPILRKENIENCLKLKPGLISPNSNSVLARLFSACTDVFIPPNIQVEDGENRIILSLQSSEWFNARLKQTGVLLTILERCIAANTDQSQTVAAADLREFLKCLVQVDGELWRRAVIQQVREETRRVFLVDRGVTGEIPRDSIRQLDAKLAAIPELAVRRKVSTPDFSEDKLVTGEKVEHQFERCCEDLDLCTVRAFGEEPSVTGAALQTENREQTEPALDATPLRLLYPRVETDKTYVGFAGTVTTPSDFYIVLGDQMSLTEAGSRATAPPEVTLPCFLRGVTPATLDRRWTEEAADFFCQCLRQKKLHVFFRELVSDSHWKVDVMVEGVHVARELVAAGHAEFTDAILAFGRTGPTPEHRRSNDARLQKRRALSADDSGREEEGPGDIVTLRRSRADRCVVL